MISCRAISTLLKPVASRRATSISRSLSGFAPGLGGVALVNSVLAEWSFCSVVIATVEQVEQQIVITIKDDGCGIDTERLKHLGEPFYSSKERGTGLGLTVSYRIIQAHRGKVTVESEVSQGTIVQIELPIN